MRLAPTLTALLLAVSLASPAVAFDVQHGGGAPASGGTANLTPDGTSVPGVSIDTVRYYERRKLIPDAPRTAGG